MPYLHFVMSPPARSDEKQAIAEVLLQHTHELLGKRPEVTSIRIDSAGADDWYIAGRNLSARSETTFYLEIKVTSGTNSDEEKARFIAAVFASMAKLRADVADASYVVIQEVAGDSWGYGGETQRQRQIRRETL